MSLDSSCCIRIRQSTSSNLSKRVGIARQAATVFCRLLDLRCKRRGDHSLRGLSSSQSWHDWLNRTLRSTWNPERNEAMSSWINAPGSGRDRFFRGSGRAAASPAAIFPGEVASGCKRSQNGTRCNVCKWRSGDYAPAARIAAASHHARSSAFSLLPESLLCPLLRHSV